VSDNFRLSEYASRSSDTHILLHTALVEVVQAIRGRLGAGVTIKRAYQAPDEHAASCGSACAATRELTEGLAVVLGSGAGNGPLLDAAAAVGSPTCFAHDGGVFVGVGQNAQGCPR